MAPRKRVDAWAVTDDFWQCVEPLIPSRQRLADKEYIRKPGAGRPPKPARLVGVRGDHVCFALQLPVKGATHRALRQCQFGTQTIPGVRSCLWFLCRLKGRARRIRPDARHRLATAEHRRGHVQGTVGARVGRRQPDRPGKHREARDTCWWTALESRCRSP